MPGDVVESRNHMPGFFRPQQIAGDVEADIRDGGAHGDAEDLDGGALDQVVAGVDLRRLRKEENVFCQRFSARPSFTFFFSSFFSSFFNFVYFAFSICKLHELDIYDDFLHKIKYLKQIALKVYLH